MALKKKFKWYAGVMKDTAVNFADTLITRQMIFSIAKAGITKIDLKDVKNASKARNKARRAKRRASKPV